MQKVSRARGFLSIKLFTKGEIYTSCFNFDQNRSASKKKMCSKCLFFSLVKKRPPMSMNRGRHGGPREKLLRGRMVFCYHVNRFLDVCQLSEIFTLQN